MNTDICLLAMSHKTNISSDVYLSYDLKNKNIKHFVERNCMSYNILRNQFKTRLRHKLHLGCTTVLNVAVPCIFLPKTYL